MRKIKTIIPLFVLCLSAASVVLIPQNVYAAIFSNVGTFTGSGVPVSDAVVGSFTVFQDTVVNASTSLQFEMKNTSGFPTAFAGLYVRISESSTTSLNALTRQPWPSAPYATTTDWRSYSGNFNGTKTLTAGKTYYVRASSQANPGNFQIRNVVIGQTANENVLDTYNFNADYKTRFLSASVSGPKNAVSFDLSYFMQLAEFTSLNRPDIVNIQIIQDGVSQDNQVSLLRQIILPLAQGTTTRSFISDYNFSPGSYIAVVTFWNIQQNNFTFARSTATLNFSVDATGVLPLTVSRTITNGLFSVQENLYEQCPILDVGCGIRNSYKFLFVPSANAVQELQNVPNTFKTRVPFNYAYSMVELFNYTPVSGVYPNVTLTNIINGESSVLIGPGSFTKLLGTPMFNFFYALATAAVYVSLAFALWDLRKRLFV